MTTSNDHVVLKDINGNHVTIKTEEITEALSNNGMKLFGLTMEEISTMRCDKHAKQQLTKDRLLELEAIAKKIASGEMSPNLHFMDLSLEEANALSNILNDLNSTRKSEPNVVFGVLDNGEIFVEVGGKQYTPTNSFYKMATIQSTKLAHKVRDLETQIFGLQSEINSLSNNKELEKLQDAVTDFASQLITIGVL